MHLFKINALAWSSTVSLIGMLAGCGGGSSSTPPPPPPTASAWVKQNAQVFATTDPAATDDSDLQKFGEAIGNARIVSLAEPDHGSGTVFDMKTRLVKYLHEKKGFDVLMMESSLFTVNRIWQQAQTGQSVDG